MTLRHLITLMDSDRTRGGEDSIVRVNVGPLCCVFETKVRLYSNDTLIKKLK